MVLQKSKQSFDYWYSNTSRESGLDLIPNHLIMYIFNHVAVFPDNLWPKQIVSNGLVNYEGEKMSKSMGNTVPLRIAIKKYGADPMRMIEVSGADIDTEFAFSAETINSVVSRNEFIMGSIDTLDVMRGTELEHIDYWLYSKINSKISKATQSMENLEFRAAYIEIYYNAINELKWYVERGGKNQMVMREFLESMTLMLAPIMPHLSEEIWQLLGNTTLAAQARWPEANTEMINEKVEQTEQIISDTIEDINNGISLTSKMDANKGNKHLMPCL